MNPQSTGRVSLASTKLSDLPRIDVGFLSHTYNRRVAIESLRAAIKFSNMPTFASITEKRVDGPTSNSYKDLLAHVRQPVTFVYHYGGSCRMGQAEDERTIVDKNFKVVGLNCLRVADHSVAPLMVNNHTQSTAYLIVSFRFAP